MWHFSTNMEKIQKNIWMTLQNYNLSFVSMSKVLSFGKFNAMIPYIKNIEPHFSKILMDFVALNIFISTSSVQLYQLKISKEWLKSKLQLFMQSKKFLFHATKYLNMNVWQDHIYVICDYLIYIKIFKITTKINIRNCFEQKRPNESQMKHITLCWIVFLKSLFYYF